MEDAIRDYLVTFSSLMTLLTAGIVTFDETGRNGIGRTSTPSLFSGVRLQPCGLVKERTLSVLGQIGDTAANVVSARGFIEIYLYNDGDAGYATIKSAKEILYDALNGRFITGAGFMRWQIDIDDMHDSSLNNAASVRSDYMITKIRS